MEPVDAPKFLVREGVEGDLPFIYSSWLKGIKYGNQWFNLIDKTAYFSEYHKVLETILTFPNTKVLVACDPLDPDTLYGYSVSGPKRLHFIFVKSRWRLAGIAKAVMPKDIETVTHLTDLGIKLLRARPSLTFNPFLIP